MIVSVLSLKGGVGKTTTAMHLAACAQLEAELDLEDGQVLEPDMVTVLDADEEGSAVSWSRMTETNGSSLGFAVVQAEKNSLAVQAKAIDGPGRVVIIDTPPNNREALTIAGMISNMVIVPLLSSAVDVDRLVNTIAMLRNVEAARGSMLTGILLTKFSGAQRLSKQTLEALESFSVFETRVRDLVRYREAFGTPVKQMYLSEYSSVWDEIKGAVS
jgi:chromosome partitioning protein